ncbi:GDP-L-fucose synthase [Campylobacter lari]|nr:GDP-L-fucose synthase [Campylobacter lari]EAI5529321.1 GDP-L-fucose synthase [Campylobacter lari]EAI6155163.1 GDP-L-fucose synthase [Campylobacter lari]EAI9064692.1 GDP-L-fucose synthase [Campylobacter lari]EAJ8995572.1 GDP-L-fucose synthase [Campylobacter lari]
MYRKKSLDKEAKIYIAGHTGTAGSAIVKLLHKRGYYNLVLKESSELDLKNQQSVEDFFKKEKPEYVFMCAATPCGVANMQYRADFIYNNIMMQINVIHASFKYKVKKMICFGSGYMYPKEAQNPLKEEYILSGKLDYSVEPYALSKIMALKASEAYNIQYNTEFICVAINNLYGGNANFDLKQARLIPALLKKFYLAKLLQEQNYTKLFNELNITESENIEEVLKEIGIFKNQVFLWGDGKTRREFIHCEDLADACIYLMEYDFATYNLHFNVGTGVDYSIADVASIVSNVVGFNGDIKFDVTKPSSDMNRLMDCSKIHSLGWKHKIELEQGIKMMYEWYLKKQRSE